MSKVLTELLAFEKLQPDTEYYVKLKNGEKRTLTWLGKYSSAVEWWNIYEVTEVLAPIPSYEELQHLESDRLAKIEGEEIIAELEEENKNLKDLLKECLIYIPYSYPTEEKVDLDAIKLSLIKCINIAIGESEE